jgi:hypothetical protein
VLDHGRIQLPGAALVYLERTLGASESYGLAPTAELPSGVVVGSVAPGEAVWLGFQPIDRESPATIRVTVEGSAPRDAVTVECPPNYCLPGPDGCAQFGAGEELSIVSSAPVRAEARVQLVAPEAFTRLTGIVPEPLE